MRTLTAPAALATARPSARPTYLLQLDFTVPTAKTLYFSDAWRRIDGVEFLPMVADWGGLEDILNTLDPDGRPATATITFFNRKPVEGKARLSDLIRTPNNLTGTYEWAFAKVTIGQLFGGLTTADVVIQGVFYLEDPTDIADDLLQVRMTDRTLVLENAMRTTVVSHAELASASPSAVGERIPRVLGPVFNVPTLAVEAGRVSRLNGAVTASQTTFPMTDSSMLPSTAVALLDTELITYTGNTGTSLTGVTRGAGSPLTTPSAHVDGTRVYICLSAYKYVVCEHDATFKSTNIANIRVNGRAPATTIVINLDDTTVIAGKRFVSIAFTAPTPGAGTTAFHLEPIMGKSISTSATVQVGPSNPQPDVTYTPSLGSMASEANVNHVTGQVTFRILHVAGQWQGHAAQVWAGSVGGAGQLLVDVVAPEDVTYSRSFDIGPELVNFPLIFHIRIIGTGPGTNDLNVSWQIQQYTATVNVDTASDQESTAEYVIGDVTCDVAGIRDDASGTITGTPNLLLEIPADCARYILMQLYGVTAAEFGATWAATRATLAAIQYKWATVIKFFRFAELRRRLGEQARSLLYLEAGKFEYKFLHDAPPVDVTLDYRHDLWSEAPAQVSRTARTDIRNRLVVSSRYDFVAGNYRRVTTIEDHTQLAESYEDDLNLDFVQDSATADALGAYWLGWRKRQHFALELVAFWNVLAVEKVDYIAVSNHPVLAAHGGAALVFRIVNRSYLLGDDNPGRIRLRGVEV